MTLPRLLLLTDRSQLPLGRGLLATLRDCIAAGASTIVLRELDESDAQRGALAGELASLGATVIAAHRALPGCAGVHLPAGGSGPATGLLGRSCHSAEDVRRAARDGASYATLSPFATTLSKPGYGPALSPAAFAGHDLPVFALGGIDARNASAAVDAGAHGIAVMGAVMRARDPAQLVHDLLAAIR